MCRIITETKQMIKRMEQEDKVGNYHHIAGIKTLLKEFKRREINKNELVADIKQLIN